MTSCYGIIVARLLTFIFSWYLMSQKDYIQIANNFIGGSYNHEIKKFHGNDQLVDTSVEGCNRFTRRLFKSLRKGKSLKRNNPLN